MKENGHPSRIWSELSTSILLLKTFLSINCIVKAKILLLN